MLTVRSATPSPRSSVLTHLSGPVGASPVGACPPPRIYRWEKTTAVAVKIKLKRLGKIREPYYRIVVADARTKRDGRAIEEIGKYHPKAEPSLIEVNSERVQHWLSVGAQPTDPVRVLLTITGDWQKFTGEPGTEGTLRTAEPRADKKQRFTAAAAESQAAKESRASQEDKGSRKGATRPAKGQAAAGDGTAKDGTAKDGAAKDGAAKPARARAAARPKPAKDTEAAQAGAGTAEAAVPETAGAEAGAGTAEAAVPETGAAEAAVPEAAVPETGAAEAEAEAGAGAAESGTVEGGEPAVSADGETTVSADGETTVR
jgi:small subunit ribosomal protein S16